MYTEKMHTTPIVELGKDNNNNYLWIKREDLIPFSFGGNKARKAALFFKEIEAGGYDSVVTYGTSSSNHCRIVANECCKRGLKCYIISPEEAREETFNSQMMKLFEAEITIVSVEKVHDTIEYKKAQLKREGHNPYFIEGGGHGNIGTEAYVQCYQEIKEQEKEHNIYFDYIFLASGTGTTQAGLVCGQLLNSDERSIIGISVARKNPRGRNVVINSIKSYLGNAFPEDIIQKNTVFLDDYTSGYGGKDAAVSDMIGYALKKYGIPLDATYTGKAFVGMNDQIKKIMNKNILFIHTGGTPLFFDVLRRQDSL